MTRTFERFLRSFSDEELVRFAAERSLVRPPYWRMLRLALQVEMARRGLDVEPGFGAFVAAPAVATDPEVPPHRILSAYHRKPAKRRAVGEGWPG